MNFKLTFTTNHELFHTYGLESSIEKILIKVGYKVRRGEREGIITDLEGNQLGQYTLSEDD